MALKVGLTGGIGSGKSTVAKVFELLGVPIYYADAASKRLYHTDPELKAALKQHFGEDIYAQEVLDRRKLASLVFGNEEKLALLNRLVHPPTIRDAEAWLKGQTAQYVIKEAALLFESGSVAGLDFVIGVYTPKSLRIQRVMQRDGVSREEVLQRIARQIEESVKMRLCDFIIQNDEQSLMLPQVLQLHQVLLQKAATEHSA